MRFEKTTLARAMKSKRALRGWTQGDLAEHSRVSLSTISAYEAEVIDRPTFPNVIKIADSLESPLGDFVSKV